MRNAIPELTALVPPPEPHGLTFDWTGTEQRLNLRLPADYKLLVETYGPGAFDGFIWVLHPSDNHNLDLYRQRDSQLDALRTLATSGIEEISFSIDPADSVLVPWAITDNGDVCYWVTVPIDDPDNWTVAINESRGPDWAIFEGSASQCLTGLLSQSLRLGIFPDDFPSARPAFQRRTA